MGPINVLLVEDEKTLAEIIKDTLEAQDFRIRIASDGEEGLNMYRQRRPDVVVADVMMPRMDGYELVRQLRREDVETPVLFLTALSGVSDVVRGFELGANDYLKKPFGMQELIVRIRALTGAYVAQRKEAPGKMDWVPVGRYDFHSMAQRLRMGKKEQELSGRESQLLNYLVQARGHVVYTRDVLMELWGDDTFYNARSLHVFITRLRKKLSDDPRIRILNVRGVGYKLLVDGRPQGEENDAAQKE